MTEQDSNGTLEATIDLVGSDDTQEIISVFVDEVSAYIEAIGNAMGQLDYQTIGRLGHTIKGDSLAVDLDDIAKVGASIEEAAKVQDAEQIQNLLVQVTTHVEQVKKGLG